MPFEEVIAPLFAAFIFGFFYTQEHAKEGKNRDILLEWTWLFVSVSLIIFSFFNDYVATAPYTYALSNYLNPYGYGLSALFIFLLIYFVWRLVKYARSGG